MDSQENSCFNCKWYWSQECNCEELKAQIETTTHTGDEYIEDGIFSENIKESINIQVLSQFLIKQLEEQGFIKKNKKIKNFEISEEEIFEYIEECLCAGIQNYFDGQINNCLLLYEPENFICKFWE